MKLIAQFVKQEICVANPNYEDISGEQREKLTKILCAACPEDGYFVRGQCAYYKVEGGTRWYGSTVPVGIPVLIDDFFIIEKSPIFSLKTTNYASPDNQPRSKNAYLLLHKLR